MSLRQWQSTCIRKALTKYNGGHHHFLCLATPASGKTRMASTLAGILLQKNKIDLVLCFSPSIIVATDFQSALEQQIHLPMDGRLGSKGQSLTYQSMLHQDDKFWGLFDKYRILVIFDEIHHCAGDSSENTNAWGEQIIQRIQGRAEFTLALTGTPWRSDRIPISLASYTLDDKVHCDFIYGLRDAVQDHVCRAPAITLIDNDHICVSQGIEKEVFTCFADLLKQSECSYQGLISNEALIIYMLEQSSKKLSSLRKHHGNAGGLIVAASVEHAYKIADILQRRILRMDGIHHGDGYLYVPAEPSLAEYAGRVIEEIPNVGTLRRDVMPSELITDDLSKPLSQREPQSAEVNTLHMDFNEPASPSVASQDINPIPQGSSLATYYEANVNMFGRFRQELLTLHQLCA